LTPVRSRALAIETLDAIVRCLIPLKLTPLLQAAFLLLISLNPAVAPAFRFCGIAACALGGEAAAALAGYALVRTPKLADRQRAVTYRAN
jgi:hypothetical protein